MNKATQRLSGNSLIYWIELNIWNKADIANVPFFSIFFNFKDFFFLCFQYWNKNIEIFLKLINWQRS